MRVSTKYPCLTRKPVSQTRESCVKYPEFGVANDVQMELLVMSFLKLRS